MSPRRAGFTLIEIMVSIGIFVVAAMLMLGTLLTASELFRSGEAARQAGDEATAVLAALRDDLSRAVPVRLRDGKPASEWGRVYASVDDVGNCTLTVVIENPDRTAIDVDGTRARLLVTWSIVAGAAPTDDQLVRTVTELKINGSANGAPVSTVITRGCLHFGAWIELASLHRLVTAQAGSPFPDWETDQPPRAGGLYDSAAAPAAMYGGSQPYWPAADAVRVSLVLTGGGRYAAHGTLAQPIADGTTGSFRIAGLKSLPTIDGSALRIDREWLRYSSFTGGLVTLADPANQRGVLRSTRSGHVVRSDIYAGQQFSLVIALPR